MKAKVFEDRCIGCRQCESICSDVFEINDDGYAHVITDNIKDEFKDDVEMAADSCPTNAIEIKN